MMQLVLRGLGIAMLIIAGLTGVMVGFDNLSLWGVSFALGVALVFRSFVFEKETFDEREQLINLKSLKVTFIAAVLLSMLFYTLYYFSWTAMPAYDAFIILIAGMVLVQGVSTFIYSRRI